MTPTTPGYYLAVPHKRSVPEWPHDTYVVEVSIFAAGLVAYRTGSNQAQPLDDYHWLERVELPEEAEERRSAVGELLVDRDDPMFQAWPIGYLDVLGVVTRDGSIMAGDGKVHTNNGLVKLDEANVRNWLGCRLVTGFLFPVVDPEVAATWACLKQDLAEAVWPDRQGIEVLFGLESPGKWELILCSSPDDSGSADLDLVFEIDTDEPSEALVLARIQVREEHGR